METKNQKEFVVQRTLIALILSILFPLISIFIEFINNSEIAFNIRSIDRIYAENPVMWLILLLVVIIPAITFYISKLYWKAVYRKQRQIDHELDRMKKVNAFIKSLIGEDFLIDFEQESEEDLLGKSLIDLRNTLKQNKEIRDKRSKEDEQRSWMAEGVAKFGSILRSNSNNIEALSFGTLSELAKYINAIQGSFYLLNDDDKNNVFFEQKALFAYDRKKFTDQRIKWGDGLIGTCGLERKTIYMTKVPESYVNITSGLGQSNPKCILITPLMSNDEIFGVLELSSLKEIQPHEITFVERVAESIAATIGSVRIAERTTRLLEESKERAHTMSAQEEEMRQNLEELQATQEELARQADKFVKLENTVNHTMIRADYTVDGTLLYANTKFLNKLEYTSNSEVEGQHISMFIGEKDREWFSQIWDNLSKGGRHFEGYMKHITKSGKDLWTMATYTCIRAENDEVERILFLAIDTTEQKKLSLKVEGIVDAVNKSSIKIELSSNANIIDINENFLFATGYDEKELKSMSIFDLIDKLDLENFSNKWETVVRGIGFHGQFKLVTKSNDIIWIRGAFGAVYDMYGDVTRVLFVGYDNTTEKQMELEVRNQADILKKQEKLLRESEKELSRKLREARIEMQNQYKETEHIKVRNERTLEGALDAIITTSHDNKIIFFNKAAEELWGYSRNEVTGQDVGILFTNKRIEEDEFLTSFTGPGDNKIVGIRKEIKISTKNHEEKPVLILLSKAQVDSEITYTAFIQNVEVELF